MKNLIMAMLLIGLAASPVFAGEAKEFAGTVDSIAPIDPERGATDGSIVVVDPSGKIARFGINVDTSVLDESSSKISSSEIEDGDMVKISYAESGSGNVAIAISRITDKSKIEAKIAGNN